jgi:hypothetical protein
MVFTPTAFDKPEGFQQQSPGSVAAATAPWVCGLITIIQPQWGCTTIVEPRWGSITIYMEPQGARRSAATLGFGVKRLRRSGMCHWQLIPNVSFVDFDAIFFAKTAKFVLEWFLPMVFDLVVNVFNQAAHMGRAD